MDIDLGYIPHPKQAIFHESPANEGLYGGAAGPGKSHALRMEGLRWALLIPGLQVYLFRRTYPELEDNHIIPILNTWAKEFGKYREQKKRYHFHNGSIMHFCHCQYEKDVFNFQGAEIHLLLIDELTSFTEFQYDYLRGRVRCALEIPEEFRHKIPGIACGTNPGGVGHEFVKRRWVDPDPGKTMKLWRAPNREGGMVRQYIPGLLEDNPTLTMNDPHYIHRLDALPEPFRTAYKNGDWDIFMGQAFRFSYDHHVCPPLPVPKSAPIYMTYDWGFGAPFSIQWWWVDGDGRLYLFHEWYGWNKTPNQGLRLADSRVARGIVEMEKKMGIWQRGHIRLAGHDCFMKKPDTKGGGQGPSTAEEFAPFGVHLTVGDSTRHLKIRQFHQRLDIPDDGSKPMVQIYDTCQDGFIRTIPLLQADGKNIEDVDSNMECHSYDSACHVFMARPIGMEIRKPKKNWFERRIDAITSPVPGEEGQDWEEYYGEEDNRFMEQAGEHEIDEYYDEYGVDEELDRDVMPTIFEE